jgi:O-antigen/teichoic acid export membrane protein
LRSLGAAPRITLGRAESSTGVTTIPGQIKWLAKRLRQGLLRDILSISGATALAQALALLMFPIISRLYTPDDFGRLTIFLSVISILAPLVSLRYELAIPVPTDHREAVDVVALSVALTVATTCFTGLLILFWWTVLSVHFDSNQISISFLLIPVGMAVLSFQNIASMWQIRAKTFVKLGGMRFATIFGTVACQLVLGYAFGGASSLLCASIVGQAIATTIAIYPYRTRIWQLAESFLEARIWRAASTYGAFALFSSPAGIINVLTQQLPNVALAWIFGSSVVGSYAFAMRVVAQPSVLFSQSVASVFWGQAVRLMHEDPQRLWRLFLHLNLFCIAIMSPGLILVMFAGDLFSLFFGGEWRQAGQFAGVMILAEMLGVAANSTTTLPFYHLNHWVTGWEALRLTLVAGSLAVSWALALPPFAFVIAITASLAISYAFLLLLNVIAIQRLLQRARSSPTSGPSMSSGNRTAMNSQGIGLCHHARLLSRAEPWGRLVISARRIIETASRMLIALSGAYPNAALFRDSCRRGAVSRQGQMPLEPQILPQRVPHAAHLAVKGAKDTPMRSDKE